MTSPARKNCACCARDVATEMAAAATALAADRKTERARRAAVNGSAAAATRHGPPLWVVSTGDNFYADGIASVDDPAVATLWADVYVRPHPPLAAAAWQVVVVNHDYEGNISAPFDIGRVYPAWHARRELYYTRTVTLPRAPAVAGGGNASAAVAPRPREILFVFLDTTPLVTKADLLRLHYRLPADALAAVAAAVDGGP